jgi:hypothetical protein
MLCSPHVSGIFVGTADRLWPHSGILSFRELRFVFQKSRIDMERGIADHMFGCKSNDYAHYLLLTVLSDNLVSVEMR